MRHTKLLGGAAALAAGLALYGCGSAPPENPVVAVAPPVVVTPAATTASNANTNVQTFQTTLGMTPLESQGVMTLQSFAGDVCVADRNGNGSVSHCICQQTNCNCQSTSTSCNP